MGLGKISNRYEECAPNFSELGINSGGLQLTVDMEK